jgi:hypothetical protein
VSTATTLFTKYPLVEAKITQGLAASIPVTNGTSDANRVAFISSLASTSIKAATPVLEGAVFVDPYYAAQFTGSVLKDIYNSTTGASPTGHTLATTDAAGIASGVGSILGQDGDALAQVSGTFAQLIVGGQLKVTNAATYATDLITGAVKSTLPASDFLQITGNSSGQKLVVGAGITAATVTDLEAIEDQFADAIVTVDSTLTTKAEATTLATALGVLAEDVAKFTKGIQFNNGSGEVYVAQYLAGTLAQFIDAEVPATTTAPFSASVTPRSLAIAAITADIDAANGNLAAVKTAVASAITAAAGSPTAYNQYLYGSITTDETAVTNF